MRLGPHLVFNGDCEAAFRFYEERLGGTELSLFRYGDEWPGKIVHGSVTVAGAHLSGADVKDGEKKQGFFLLLAVDGVAEAERLFQTLAEGGTIQMPLQKTFWSPAFGVVIDRFGVPWEISSSS
jgi:PhnB protein